MTSPSFYSQMEDPRYVSRMLDNFAINATIVPTPVKDGIIFNYDPEAPVLDKSGKKTGKTYGKLTTTIIFDDGTKCTCSNSQHDPVSSKLVTEHNGIKLPTPVITADDSAKEFGIVNCVFKRIISDIIPESNGKLSSVGASTFLKKLIADFSYDQPVMSVYGTALKKKIAADNTKKHEETAKKAHDRKIKRMVKRLANEKLAAEILAKGQPKENKSSSCCCRKIPVETKPIEVKKPTCCSTMSEKKTYKRPNKSFSEFTPEERREYWRAQKAGLL